MNVKYHQYTVSDVRAWLYEGVENGLSEQIISKVRANAILHNPFVENDMVVVVSATDRERVVGYTAMFPDYLVHPDIRLSCATTLYAHPDFASEFIGYYVSKALHDTANGRCVIGSDIAPATVLIDKLLGLKKSLFERRRYVLNRHIQVDSIRHLLSRCYEPVRKFRQRRALRAMIATLHPDVYVEYTDFIDHEAYQFILEHSATDAFVRSQQMLNWMIRYPFRVSAYNWQRIARQSEFDAQCPSCRTSLAKVYWKNKLIGLYMLAKRKDDGHIMLLYVESQTKEWVYALLLEDVFKQHFSCLWSIYPDLNEFVNRMKVSLKMYKSSFVFTHPEKIDFAGKQLQGADGDMFA